MPELASERQQYSEWTVMFREWRHSHCLMAPLATFVVLAMGLTSLIALACSVPQFVLGLLVVS